MEHMKKAALLGDCLIVIIGSDEQIKRKYGYVLQPLHKRVERILRKVDCVQGIIVSVDKDSTACETLKLIKPNVYAKGGDRTPSNIPLKELGTCDSIGCQVVYGIGDSLNSSMAIRCRIEHFRKSAIR